MSNNDYRPAIKTAQQYSLFDTNSDLHFKRRDLILLLLITLLGAVIRTAYQLDRPFTGDEIGTLIYIEEDYGYLLTNFQTWLSMNYFLIIEKALTQLFGTSTVVLIAIPFLAGVGSIPLSAKVARHFLPAGPSLAVALLV